MKSIIFIILPIIGLQSHPKLEIMAKWMAINNAMVESTGSVDIYGCNLEDRIKMMGLSGYKIKEYHFSSSELFSIEDIIDLDKYTHIGIYSAYNKGFYYTCATLGYFPNLAYLKGDFMLIHKGIYRFNHNQYNFEVNLEPGRPESVIEATTTETEMLISECFSQNYNILAGES